jgi:hypothetical protein
MEQHFRGHQVISNTLGPHNGTEPLLATTTPKFEEHGWTWLLPSGNLTVCYWKLSFIADLPIKNGGSFHSDVSLPEGMSFQETRTTHVSLPLNVANWCSCRSSQAGLHSQLHPLEPIVTGFAPAGKKGVMYLDLQTTDDKWFARQTTRFSSDTKLHGL